jgi:hypothetical protein
MAKKIKQIVELVLGKVQKKRFKRILIILGILGLFIFMFTNLGYNKKQGFYIKPWNIEIKKGAE